MSLSQIPYRVHFIGLKDSQTLKVLKTNSALMRQKNHPPASINALRYRIESDIPELIRIMKSYGYYDAEITSDIQSIGGKVNVYLFLQPGVRYVVGSYTLLSGSCQSPLYITDCEEVTMKQIGLRENQPAISQELIDAELNVLTQLAKCSYPLAAIERRQYQVDVSEKTVDTTLCVKERPPMQVRTYNHLRSQDR